MSLGLVPGESPGLLGWYLRDIGMWRVAIHLTQPGSETAPARNAAEIR